VIAGHELVDGRKIAAEMLTTLENLKAERVLKEIVAFGTFVGNFDDSGLEVMVKARAMASWSGLEIGGTGSSMSMGAP